MKKICFLTIGQSPREDIIMDISPFFSSIDIMEKGALDNLSFEEIERLEPDKDDIPLITRLRNGKSAKVGKSKIFPLLLKNIKEIESYADIVVLLCTEEFKLSSSIPVIFPFEIMKSKIYSMKFEGKLLVFVPLKEQKEMAVKKWKCVTEEVEIKVFNPYESGSSKHDFSDVKNYRVAVLDCIGYRISLVEKLKGESNLTVISPRIELIEELKGILR
ncbi:MAG: AroM family protein [Candidatus Aminicenantia bacterium]